MYKLMIVEDEKMIRRGIVNGVNWNDFGFEVVAEAKHGQEALNYLDIYKIDVIITDIKMPIMDGIELSKKIRENHSDIEIIVLSGFAEFEYAREAINFSAFEYILKPTKKPKLIEVINKVKIKLDNKRKDKGLLLKQNLLLNEGYEKLKKDLLLDIIEGNKHSFNGITQKLRDLEIDFECNLYTCALINIVNIEEKLKSSWDNNKKLLIFTYKNIINEILEEYGQSLFLVKDIDEIVIIFGFDSINQQKDKMFNILNAISNKLYKIVIKESDAKVNIGIGFSYPSILQMEKSYKQSKKALYEKFFDSENHISLYKNDIEYNSQNQWIKNYSKEVSIIVDTIIKGDLENTKNLINSIFEKFNELKINPDMIKTYCYVFTLALATSTYDLIDKNETKKIEDNFEDIIRNSISLSQLKDYIVNLSISITEKFSEVNSKKIPNEMAIVEKVQKYIKQNYHKKISLQDISDEVFLSPNYVSCLFKKITGETYIDYLQNIRMMAAKNMLEDRSKKVYEIAFEIGYTDYKYFASKFKKIVGMSPKEYRKSNIE